jgi:hypothetical protein
MSIKQLKSAINKFSFAQMTSNSDGKTSGSGTMGVLICTVGAICFLMGCIDKMFIGKDIDILNQAIIFTLIGAGLLGYRKSVKTKDFSIDESEKN